MDYFSRPALFIFVFILSACEGHFPGDRPENLTVINQPYEMKIVQKNGTNYLAVLNSNSRGDWGTASLQLYNINSATAPTLATNPKPLSLPSNSLDFVLDPDGYLYVADRKDDDSRILFFQPSGDGWLPRVDSSGRIVPSISIPVASNPMQMIRYHRPSDGKDFLAVISSNRGVLHFIDLTTFQLVGPDLTAAGVALRGGRDPDLNTIGTLVGGGFLMNPRRLLDTSKNDPIALAPDEQAGVPNSNIGVLFPTTTSPIFVTGSLSATALFGFRFETYENNANIAWDLGGYRGGGTVNGASIKGTGQQGVRSVRIDDNGNIFFSSRADDSIYKVDSAELNLDKVAAPGETVATRNTRGYLANDQHGKLVTLDTNLTDDVFPRIGDLALDCSTNYATSVVNCGGGGASIVYAVGMGDPSKGNGTLYKINATTGAILATVDTGAKQPLKVVYYSTLQVIYVGHARDNIINIFDTNLTKIGTIKIGTIKNP